VLTSSVLTSEWLCSLLQLVLVALISMMLSPHCSMHIRCMPTAVLPNVLPWQLAVNLKPGCCSKQLLMQTKAAVADTMFCSLAASTADCALVPFMLRRIVLVVALRSCAVRRIDVTSVLLVMQDGQWMCQTWRKCWTIYAEILWSRWPLLSCTLFQFCFGFIALCVLCQYVYTYIRCIGPYLVAP